MKKNDGYIRSLDGVRALAIILVMTFHAGITYFGWMGVQLFFVLSGYLITGILWKEKFKEQPLSFRFKKFWVRRTLRIFPLYFGYLIVLGISYLVVHFPSYYTDYAPWLFTYTFNYTRLLHEWQGNPLFTHLWSLSIEEQFYLFFPLIVLLAPVRWLKTFMIVVIVLAPFTRYLLGLYYQARAPLPVAADAVYWNTLSHLDAFFLGGCIPVFALHKKINRTGLLLVATTVLALGAGLIYYLVAGNGRPFLLDLGYDHDAVIMNPHVWRYTVLNLVFAAAILHLLVTAGRRSFSNRILEHETLVRIGRVSYGMYIFHWLVYVYIFARLFPVENIWLKILLFLPYLAVVYAVAALSYRFYESWFLRLKDKLYARTRAVGTTPQERMKESNH